MTLIPAERFPVNGWVPGVTVGVLGGIPTTRGLSPYNTFNAVTDGGADNTGATNAGFAIQTLANAARSNDVVYCPPGRYLLNPDGLTLQQSVTYPITIRGAGKGLTTFVITGIAALRIGGSVDGFPLDIPTVGSCARGDTSVVVTDTGNLSEFYVGMSVAVGFANDLTIPTFQGFGFDLENASVIRYQYVKITAISGATISFANDPLETGASATILRHFRMTYDMGFEDCTIDASSSPNNTQPVLFTQASGCWMKNVEILGTFNYHIHADNLHNCEIRGVDTSIFLSPSATNQSGLKFVTSTGCLVEDCIFADNYPCVEMSSGCTRNVFGLCCLIRDTANITFDTNHGPFNMYTLIDGCCTDRSYTSDGYFGGEIYLMIFRCYAQHGTEFKRFGRKQSVIGCITGGEIACGLPNMSTGYYNGAQSLNGVGGASPWNEWLMTGVITTRDSDTVAHITLDGGKVLIDVPGNGQSGRRPTSMVRYSPYGPTNAVFSNIEADQTNINIIRVDSLGSPFPVVGTAVRLFFAQGGYQEIDLDVAATLIDKGNYRTDDLSYSSLGGDSLPNSLYTTQAEAEARGVDFSGTPGIPAYTALGPVTPHMRDIPAGLRAFGSDASIVANTVVVTNLIVG